MEIDLELNEKRLEVKNEITVGLNKTPMAILFNTTGKLIQKITRDPKPLPLIYSAAVLVPTILIPWLLLTLLFRETGIFVKLGLFPMIVLIEDFFLGVILTYFNVNKVLRGIRDTLIDSILSTKDLSDLQQWLSLGWSSKTAKRVYWYLFLGLFFVFAYISILEIGLSGLGLIAFFLVSAFLGGIGFYYAPIMILLPIRLRYYSLALYENDPSRSEVISNISGILNNFIYGYVFINLLFQLGLALINVPVLVKLFVMLVFMWTPVIIQSITNQIGIWNIVSLSKRKTLNRIQAQIKTLHDGDITNKDNLEIIDQLMDYHERIRVTPNSNLNAGWVLNFLNQLALPLLGFLLGNIDKIIDFFR